MQIINRLQEPVILLLLLLFIYSLNEIQNSKETKDISEHIIAKSARDLKIVIYIYKKTKVYGFIFTYVVTVGIWIYQVYQNNHIYFHHSTHFEVPVVRSAVEIHCNQISNELHHLELDTLGIAVLLY